MTEGPATDGPATDRPVQPLVVDARGTRCPVPVLRLAAAVRGVPEGTSATVLASDPAVEHDVPAWAAMRGHTVVALAREGDGWRVEVRTGAGPAGRRGSGAPGG